MPSGSTTAGAASTPSWRGLDFDYFYFKDIDPVFDYYTPILIANNAFLADHPDTAKAFLAAVAQGYEYAIEHPEEAAQILIEGDATGSLAGSEDLIVESQKWMADQYKAEVDQWGYIDPARWNAFYNWLNDNGLVDHGHPGGHRLLQRLPAPDGSGRSPCSGRRASPSPTTAAVILKDVSLHLDAGELVCLLGVSGAGKTTLFHCPVRPGNAGGGTGASLRGGHHRPARQDQLHAPAGPAAAPQEDPRQRGPAPGHRRKSKREARAEAAPYFAPFGLSGTEDKYPAQLSGGMRQRAALLRTFLGSKGVVLLDEPFSALDALTKRELHRWYMGMMDQLHLTTLFITHDIDEAILLSDRIYILAGHPGTIAAELTILPPRPRDLSFGLQPEFLDYKRQILSRLEQ